MKIQTILFSLLLILGNIIVGTLESDNVIIVNCIIICSGIVYYIYKLIKCKEYKIIENKLDLFVFIFLMICPLLPIVFNTFASLEKSMLEIYRTVTVFCMYIFTRDLMKSDKNNIKIILNSLLISGLFFCIIGLDMKISKVIYTFLYEKLDFALIKSSSYIVSIFGYKNGFGIYMGLMFLISLYFFKEYSKKYIILMIVFALFLIASGSLIAIAFTTLIIIIYLINCMKNKKKFLIITGISFLAILAIIVLSIFIITKNKDTYIFDGVHNDRYALGNIDSEKEYTFNFEVENPSDRDYKIKIREINVMQDDESDGEIKIESGFKGTKTYTITTGAHTRYVYIQFCENKEASEDLIVYGANVNNKEIVFKYKYLPSSFVRMAREYIFKLNSITERIMMIQAGVKLGMQEPIIGQGAHTWYYRSSEFQEYVSGANYMHSYIVDVFIQYGMIGIIIFFGILICTILTYKKNKDNSLKLILFVLLLIVLHSSLDFDMKYLTIFLDMFVLLGIVSSYQHSKNETKENTVVQILILSIYIIVFAFSFFHMLFYITGNAKFEGALFYRTKNNLNLALDYVEIGEYDEALEILKKVTNKEKYKNLYIYFCAIDYSKVSSENLEYAYNYFINHNLTVNYQYNVDRNNAISRALLTTNDEYAEKFANIIISENDEMVERIKDYEQSRSGSSSVERRLKVQNKQYNTALKRIQEIESQ